MSDAGKELHDLMINELLGTKNIKVEEGKGLYDLMKEQLDAEIIKAEDRIKDKYNLHGKPEEEIEELLVVARTKTIKNANSAIEKLGNFLRKNYREELLTGKEAYPKTWMLSDKRIKKTLDTSPLTSQFLNYLFNRNRNNLSGEHFKAIISPANGLKFKKEVKGKTKYYDYAPFVTNKDFYNDITKELGCSKIYIQKFLKAFQDAGIIVWVRNAGNQRVYADGYYAIYQGGQKKKVAFLKNTLDFKKALRVLSQQVRR